MASEINNQCRETQKRTRHCDLIIDNPPSSNIPPTSHHDIVEELAELHILFAIQDDETKQVCFCFTWGYRKWSDYLIESTFQSLLYFISESKKGQLQIQTRMFLIWTSFVSTSGTLKWWTINVKTLSFIQHHRDLCPVLFSFIHLVCYLKTYRKFNKHHFKKPELKYEAPFLPFPVTINMHLEDIMTEFKTGLSTHFCMLPHRQTP